MKALLISDIHANIYALEAVWRAERDSDVVYCAGDLVDYGPFPREVLDWVREHRAICVQGNHDRAVAAAYRDGETLWSLADEELHWKHCNARLLTEEDVRFLEALPESVPFLLDSVGYSLQHMYVGYETIVSLPQFEEYWQMRTSGESGVREAPERRLVFGHTHRRCVHYLSDRELWLNPGSLSYRRKDDPTRIAHYITISDDRMELKSADYDRSPLYRTVSGMKLNEAEKTKALGFFR
ncbi:metallophosphoesterase family protein [Paenibacillus sp. GYB003]|uniref:metallophosphoesterase family protein n=1 Tax=Paenibacillus sp. GYB003 TaxID=2994392 RepID=UPI002F96780E